MRFLEPFRVATRSLIPKSIYQRFSSLTNHFTAVASLGYENYRQLYRDPQNDLAKVIIQNKNFYFRPGTPDADAIVQNVVRHEWLQSPLRHADYILDGGAYIGDTTFAFLLKYPNAKVICVEPNSKTQPILRRNLDSIAKDAVLVCGGIANTNKSVIFGGEFLDASIQSCEAKSGATIDCFGINFLMKEHRIPFFDIVKLDIEGAELEVLTSNNEWLDKTRRLLVEFHGKEIEEACKKELANRGFSHYQFRSAHYFDKLQ